MRALRSPGGAARAAACGGWREGARAVGAGTWPAGSSARPSLNLPRSSAGCRRPSVGNPVTAIIAHRAAGLAGFPVRGRGRGDAMLATAHGDGHPPAGGDRAAGWGRERLRVPAGPRDTGVVQRAGRKADDRILASGGCGGSGLTPGADEAGRLPRGDLRAPAGNSTDARAAPPAPRRPGVRGLIHQRAALARAERRIRDLRAGARPTSIAFDSSLPHQVLETATGADVHADLGGRARSPRPRP